MAGLDNLVNKIADEAKLEADEIILQAENKAKALREEAKLLLDKEAERLEAKNELQRNLIKEQLKSGAELRARNNRLATKQAVIAQIFQEVYSELVMKFYREGIRAIENGVYLSEISTLPIREEIARAKYVPEEEIEKLDEISVRLTDTIDEMINKGGNADA